MNKQIIDTLNKLTYDLNKATQTIHTLLKIIRLDANNTSNPSGRSRKIRSDRIYLSKNEKQKAYRKRKKEGTGNISATSPSLITNSR